jgi:hypothetical protein
MPAIVVALLLASVQPVGARSVHASTPVVVGSLDSGKLKGEPIQLAWSSDDTQLFLQTAERDSVGMIKNPHYFLMWVSDGKPSPVQTPPDWAISYWSWKSNKTAPGSSTFSIDIKQEIKTNIPTASPMGGSLARGGAGFNPDGGGTSIEDVTMRAQQMQKQQVITITLRNETIGEFVNQQFLPGYTFGWSPRQVGLIAYSNPDGHLVVMDEQGEKQELAGTRDAVLPAWSTDGSKIAFLQRTGKKKYDIVVIVIGDVKP